MAKNNKKLQVVLIDDEEKGRTILKKIIEEYVENVEVVATASDVLDGVKIIHRHDPDVVFLDIEMPGYSGFKLVEYFDEMYVEGGDKTNQNFEIVFTTAYEKYALKAYKASAIGYLLKPIDIDELIEIFKKINKKREIKYQNSIDPKHYSEKPHRIVFPTQSGLIYLSADEICSLESSNRYTNVFLLNGEELLITLSLKDCFAKLANSTFIRIHRSFIINLSYIQNYSRGRDSFVIMDNEKKVDVGLFYKDDLNSAIAAFLK